MTRNAVRPGEAIRLSVTFGWTDVAAYLLSGLARHRSELIAQTSGQ